MKKILLVLNGSHSEIPLIQSGKKLGFYVVTTGNVPEMPGHSYADQYCREDFFDKEAILALAKKLNISAICSCANDFGIITAAYVAEKLNLPGHDSFDVTCKLHHKDTFRQITEKCGIHSPVAKAFSSVDEANSASNSLEYPVIVKPIDLTGGKGVSRADNPDELKAAVKKAFAMTRSKTIVIEPFLEGTLHSFSTFIVNQKIVAHFSDNEYTYKNPYLISSSAGPATDIEHSLKILIDDMEKLAHELKLVDGVFHAQYILSDGLPYIIEITRRCSGDFYPVPVEYARDIPWSEMTVRAECGLPVEKNIYQMHEPQRFGGRHCIMGDRNGTVKDIIIADEIKDNIYGSFIWFKSGYIIDDYLKNKLGVLFLKFDSEREMLDKINRITELVKIVYRD